MAVTEHVRQRIAAPAAAETRAARPAPAAAETRAARADLRAQIARLERQIAHVVAASYPWLDPRAAAPDPLAARGGPRVLGLGELELVRDALAAWLGALRVAAVEQAERQAAARERLAAMLADPPAHRGARIANAELGLPGCTVYAVRPRFGPLGRLARWWQVKVSSGCPLRCRA
jgi:hypothetical protein